MLPKAAPAPLTHFLCLPVATSAATPQLTAALARFAKDKAVLDTAPLPADNPSTSPPESSKSSISSSGDDGSPSAEQAFLPPKAIRPAGTLHLTLGVMSLQEKSRVDAALDFLKGIDLGDVLQEATAAATSRRSEPATDAAKGSTDRQVEGSSASASPSSTGRGPPVSAQESTRQPPEPNRDDPAPEPLVFTLQGLHSMFSPTKTSVLYAHPHDPSNRLFPFCKRLHDEFMRAGLLVDQKRELKLHATIVNTVYASEKKKGKGKGRGKGRGGRREGPLNFDATELMERWKEEVWAEPIRVERVAVCEMGAKEDEEGMLRYVEAGSLEMPC